MVNDASKYEAQDKEQRERIEAKNGLENYAYSMKNTISDPNVAGKLDESDKTELNAAIEAALNWLNNNQEASRTSTSTSRRSWRASARCTRAWAAVLAGCRTWMVACRT
eukprot:gene4593-biopygen3095